MLEPGVGDVLRGFPCFGDGNVFGPDIDVAAAIHARGQYTAAGLGVFLACYQGF
ncbi:hypothetical protein [Aquitalea magnusonii]|uniref:hypothetical protein n=1 Tax=Aquitalea magnusonii TaxID=332411 RepID=UPI001E2C9FBF|nr:hypothetical protein [Aquitalea magnusonii]